MTDQIVMIKGGVASFVYADDLAPLLEIGTATVTRASHVEPASTYCAECRRPYRGGWPCACVLPTTPVAATGWVADMAPDGPLLGPFPLRQAALDAERRWLSETWGL